MGLCLSCRTEFMEFSLFAGGLMEPNLNSITSVCDGNPSHLCADFADRAIVVLVPLNSSWLRQQDTLFKQLSHILESGCLHERNHGTLQERG